MSDQDTRRFWKVMTCASERQLIPGCVYGINGLDLDTEVKAIEALYARRRMKMVFPIRDLPAKDVPDYTCAFEL